MNKARSGYSRKRLSQLGIHSPLTALNGGQHGLHPQPARYRRIWKDRTRSQDTWAVQFEAKAGRQRHRWPRSPLQAGRSRPFGYRLEHPYGSRPLGVLAHYEGTSRGCDTIRAVDGGLQEAARWAASFARSGHDVVMEGLRLSCDTEHTTELAQGLEVRVVRLMTPVERCVRQVVARRRAHKLVNFG